MRVGTVQMVYILEYGHSSTDTQVISILPAAVDLECAV